MAEKGLLLELEDEDMGVVCGTDEAGRGPLAGPVTAAAVILPPDFPISLLDDSKKMTGKERDEAALIIKQRAVAWAVTHMSHKVIDKVNILQASLWAMRRSAEKVHSMHPFDILLADGNRKPDVPWRCRAIVKGDAKIPEIMAASILAKTERDRIMMLCDAKWPEYGYRHHKGYPTPEHRRAIAILGPSPIERMTFTVKEEDDTPSLL